MAISRPLWTAVYVRVSIHTADQILKAGTDQGVRS